MGLFNKEKYDLQLMGLRVKGYDQGMYLFLRATYDKKDYNDYLTIERSLGRGQGYEVVFTISFKDIEELTYKKPLFGLVTISIKTKDNNEILSDLKIERDYFSKDTMNRMIKIYEASKKND